MKIGLFRTITNWRFNLYLLIASYGIFKLFIHCLFSNRNPLYFISNTIHFTLYICKMSWRQNTKWWWSHKNYIIRYRINNVHNVFIQFNKVLFKSVHLKKIQAVPVSHLGLINVSKYIYVLVLVSIQYTYMLRYKSKFAKYVDI
jgi:hypothetical protein